MPNICNICQPPREFATPAALGSHKRIHKPKQEAQEAKLVSSGEPVTIKLVVEQASQDSKPKPYTCPECSGELELMLDSPGIFKLRCLKCWEGG